MEAATSFTEKNAQKKKKRYPHTMYLAGIHFCGMRGCYKYPSHKISLIMNDIDR